MQDSSYSGTQIIFSIALAIIAIAAMWRVFTKAKQPGWAAIIPFYNFYIQCKIVGRPGWWWLLLFIPIVNLVITIIVSIDLAKSFSKSAAYGFFLLFLLSPIGYLMLGFGSAQYKGKSVNS